jgi:hypothetical protein
MAIITTADRVRETTNTTGTGTLSLDGAVSNYQSFIDGVGDGSVITYCIIHRNSNEWEVGYGTITNATPDTLSRTYISFSSNSGSIVNLSSGTKDVFITHSSEFVVTKNTDGKINVEDGGTNISSYSSGDLIYASGATALSKLSAASAGNVLLSGTSPSWGKITSSHVDSSISLAGHTHAHSTITGLTSGDDHTQYALLAGRSGGQVFYGSTLARENLDLHSTSHGTKGLIRFRGNVSGGNGSSFDFLADVTGTNVSRMRFTSGNIIVGNNLDISDGAFSVFTIEGAENDSTGSATIASLAFANDSNRSGQTSDPIAQISASVADFSVGPNLGQLDFYTKDGTTLLKRATITKDGRLGVGTTPTATLHLQAGGTAVSSAPLKFTSGSLLTTPEVGAVEFLTDAFYATITTGAARRTFAFLESPVFTTPTLGVASATSLTSTIVYGGTGSGGNLSLTSTTHATKGNVVFNGFSYVSPTGVFFGDMNGTLTGNVVGSVTGSSGSCTGNAATATVLQTTRTIGGSSFNGSANVTSFPAPGAIGGTTPSTIAATSLACPTFTSAAAMGFTPAAGSGFNVTLSGAGDFLINSTQFVVDVSTGNVGVNNASPAYKFDLTGGQRIVGSLVVSDAGEMVTNGTFASNITGWTDSSTGVESIAWNAGGWMDLFSTGAGYARADQQLVTVPGVRYKVTFTAGGTLVYTALFIGTTQGGVDLLNQAYPLPAGSNVYYFTATSTSSWLRFDNGGGTSTIDNVSVTSGNATFAGNVCIGNTTGTAMLSVGSTSQFNVTSAGAATAVSLSCSTFTSSAAMGFTPAAGSGVNFSLTTTGDFAVNTNQLYVDTSTGNIGVGTAIPNANALLDLTSTTKAFMPPRMTTTQRDAIASPTEGMYVHNTTTKGLNFYNGTSWVAV